MAFALHRDSSVETSLIRIAREQITSAIAEAGDCRADRHETVHQLRKRCKKLRALIRLVRPALGDTYRRENACFRDAARLLAAARDAQAQVECLDKLAASVDGGDGAALAGEIRDRLLERRDQLVGADARLDATLEGFVAIMQDAHERAGNWRLSGEPAGSFAPVAAGLKRNYRRGRKAMTAAYTTPCDERFHEWRKATKYHAHHLQILRPLWRPVLQAEQAEADVLAGLLGDEHDLALLAATLRAAPAGYADAGELEAAVKLMERRRRSLQRRARVIGARLFAEPPGALTERFTAYWNAWHRGAPRSSGRRRGKARAA